MKKVQTIILIFCVLFFVSCGAGFSIVTVEIVGAESAFGEVAHVVFAPMNWDSFTDGQRVKAIHAAIDKVRALAKEQGVEGYGNIYGVYADGTVLFHGTSGINYVTYNGNDFLEKGPSAGHPLDI